MMLLQYHPTKPGFVEIRIAETLREVTLLLPTFNATISGPISESYLKRVNIRNYCVNIINMYILVKTLSQNVQAVTVCTPP